MDPLIKLMIDLMLDQARSADELREAIDDAVDWIEDHPRATGENYEGMIG